MYLPSSRAPLALMRLKTHDENTMGMANVRAAPAVQKATRGGGVLLHFSAFDALPAASLSSSFSQLLFCAVESILDKLVEEDGRRAEALGSGEGNGGDGDGGLERCL